MKINKFAKKYMKYARSNNTNKFYIDRYNKSLLKKYYKTNDNFLIKNCRRQIGKTTSLLTMFLHFLCNEELKEAIFVVRDKSMIKILLEEINPIIDKILEEQFIQRTQYSRFFNTEINSTITFITENEINKICGKNVDLIILDEFDSFNNKKMVMDIINIASISYNTRVIGLSSHRGY